MAADRSFEKFSLARGAAENFSTSPQRARATPDAVFFPNVMAESVKQPPLSRQDPEDSTPILIRVGQFTEKDKAPREVHPPTGIAAEGAKAALADTGIGERLDLVPPWSGFNHQPAAALLRLRQRSLLNECCMSVRLAIALLVCVPALPAGTIFEDTIQPILNANCLPCHDQHNRMSGFSVQDAASVTAGGARRGTAVTPGEPGDSVLLKMLRGHLEPRMPFGKPALAEAELAAVEDWIRGLEPETADAEKPHWAFMQPRRDDPPAIADVEWARNGIDHFILSKLEAKGLTPAAEAPPKTLIRRLYFDLIGLPPTWEHVEAFVEDSSPDAYEKLVDHLLADPHYGERWARHWLDLARYADSAGYEGDPEYYHAWRYRDYVVDAFNNDKPYDRFVKEQIAGDEFVRSLSAGPLPAPEPEHTVALTFLRLAPITEPRGERSRHELLTEMTSTVSSVFLGLTAGCAQCHDHKYDPIPIRDFYRLKAFFSTVYMAPARSGDIFQIGGPQPAEFYRPGEKEWADREREKHEKELKEVEAEFEEFQAPLLRRLKAAKKDKPAEGAEETDDEKKELTASDLSKAIKEEDAGDSDESSLFSPDERKGHALFRRRVRILKDQILRVEPSAMSLRTMDPPPYGPSVPTTYVLNRGQWDQPTEPVEPGFLSAVTGHSQPAELIEVDRYQRHPGHGRRMTLANWIASPENPLTARVMMNRLWQYRFGQGIVETSSDFGKNGALPTHPELLDWLAVRFVDEKWSLKAMQRLMVTSGTYRQASQRHDDQAEEADPENRLLWRFPRQRLEGEVIRDSVLAVSGRLNPARGGPPISPPLPRGLENELDSKYENNFWEPSSAEEARKRSLYVFQRRSLALPMLQTFDAPVPDSSCDRRRTSITPLQALSLYDGDFVNEESRHFALRVAEQSGADVESLIRRAFQLTLSRNPSADESKQVQGVPCFR